MNFYLVYAVVADYWFLPTIRAFLNPTTANVFLTEGVFLRNTVSKMEDICRNLGLLNIEEEGEEGVEEEEKEMERRQLLPLPEAELGRRHFEEAEGDTGTGEGTAATAAVDDDDDDDTAATDAARIGIAVAVVACTVSGLLLVLDTGL